MLFRSYNDEIRRLVNYLQHRNEFDKDIKIENYIEKDKKNIIKIGEILYALSFVKQGCADTREYIKELSGLLKSSIKNTESWNFFTDSNEPSDILPTAFAYLGLRSNNFDDLEPVEKYLAKTISDLCQKDRIDNPSTFAKVHVAMYVLSKFDIDCKQSSNLKRLSKSQFFTFNYSVEQNIEYPYDYEHFYVRIPWQLYFLSVASKNSPKLFTKKNSRRRITDICEMVNNLGFKYTQSGKELSSRTNAILFDTLDFIEKHLKKSTLYYFYSIINDIIWFFNRKWLKILLLVIIILCMFFSIFKWVNNPNTENSDLAPEFIGYFVSLMILSLKR